VSQPDVVHFNVNVSVVISAQVPDGMGIARW
jgi:hypothetical protein